MIKISKEEFDQRYNDYKAPYMEGSLYASFFYSVGMAKISPSWYIIKCHVNYEKPTGRDLNIGASFYNVRWFKSFKSASRFFNKIISILYFIKFVPGDENIEEKMRRLKNILEYELFNVPIKDIKYKSNNADYIKRAGFILND